MLITLLHAQVSLGNLSPELNENYSKTFSEYVTKELGIKDDRGYLCVTTILSEQNFNQ